MNTRKTIYDKLFTEKVELAKHEIELGLVDDVKKVIATALNNKKEFKLYAAAGQTHLGYMKTSAETWGKNLTEAQRLINSLTTKAKELGIAVPTEITNYDKIINEGIASTIKYISIINKVKAELPKE